jgi:peptidoglycan-associated lipoprotein
MRLKMLSVLAIVALVSACSSDKDTGDNGMAGGGAGMGAGSGMGAGRNGMVTPGTEEDLAQNVGDRVFFATDHSDLSSEARGTLDRQAQWLKKYANLSITIEGNSDERGTREYNLALGERRADAVRKYLVASGVEASRIQTISYGKERPAVEGNDESAWAQNRRAVTVVN